MGIIGNVKEEIRLIRERDPAIHSSMEVFLYPSFRAMLHYRVAHKLYLSGHYFLARWISQRAVRKTGIEIHPGAKIGKGFFIDHGNGVIIGETAEIGNNVTLYQGVTLGGTGKEQGKQCKGQTHPQKGGDHHSGLFEGGVHFDPKQRGDRAEQHAERRHHGQPALPVRPTLT